MKGTVLFMNAKKDYLSDSSLKTQEHSLVMSNRQRLTLTGVIDVGGFCDDKIEVKTAMGAMLIKGKNLNINKLNTDTGELDIDGSVNSVEYLTKKDGGFISRLFG